MANFREFYYYSMLGKWKVIIHVNNKYTLTNTLTVISYIFHWIFWFKWQCMPLTEKKKVIISPDPKYLPLKHFTILKDLLYPLMDVISLFLNFRMKWKPFKTCVDMRVQLPQI